MFCPVANLCLAKTLRVFRGNDLECTCRRALRYDSLHDLDITRYRVAGLWEVFANRCSRFIDTFAAHNATAGMNPKAIFGVRLRKQCPRLRGSSSIKISLKLRISSSEEVAFIN